ncbi:hypothetical protein [Sphingomonas lycopersici]|uniref:Lipoprotein n=1 Tax=Sphingomonas lycopersici TaxID=2951807 RepID=A0AA41ZIU0_9SPHN|nr:hypothetical protein [Sphingomonas lycopersici]MCW6537729.1 hypothetical protein [Sphingomonas lycopersici]
MCAIIRASALLAVIVLLNPAVSGCSRAISIHTQVLNVGATKIACLRRPCPHRGVYRPVAGGLEARKDALIYADNDGRIGPPHLDAAPEIAAAVKTAWDAQKCVQIDGSFDTSVSGQPTLHIVRLLGACP